MALTNPYIDCLPNALCLANSGASRQAPIPRHASRVPMSLTYFIHLFLSLAIIGPYQLLALLCYYLTKLQLYISHQPSETA
jgi:hypothetical protein